jgi:hypothetical protein
MSLELKIAEDGVRKVSEDDSNFGFFSCLSRTLFIRR